MRGSSMRGRIPIQSKIKCFGADHMQSRCQKLDNWCRLCQYAGHKPGQSGCGSVSEKHQEDVWTIYGYRYPLSNRYSAMCLDKSLTQQCRHMSTHKQSMLRGQKLLRTSWKHPMQGQSNSLPATSPTTQPGNSSSRKWCRTFSPPRRTKWRVSE